MIMLCERCYAPIEESEPVLRLAHIAEARNDGGISWVYAYVHTSPCTAPRPAAHQRPDTGAWDPQRSIGSYRA